MFNQSRPNIFGGQDVFGANGQKQGSTRPNIFGGQDVFGANGQRQGFTKPNIFGGQDFIPDKFNPFKK